MFLRFYFFIYSLVLVSIEKIHQTLETVFRHISKHLKFHQKYSVAHHIVNSLLSVWKYDETLSLMFDILHHAHCQWYHKNICRHFHSNSELSNALHLNYSFYFSCGMQRMGTTIVWGQNMQICHSLRCKHKSIYY